MYKKKNNNNFKIISFLNIPKIKKVFLLNVFRINK